MTHSIKYNFYRLLTVVLVISIWSCEENDYSYKTDAIQPLQVNSYEPYLGDIGYEVTITGENFSLLPSNNKVKFNGVSAKVISATEDALVVEVPEGASTGELTISHGSYTVSAGTFSVYAIPIIESFSPLYGQVGEEIVIEGIKFSTNIEENTVLFNGVEAEIIEATETSIIAIVPENTTSGPISVTVNGQTTTSTEDFTLAYTFVTTIMSNDDDVEEIAVIDPSDPDDDAVIGFMDLGSSDYELGEMSNGQGLMNVGLRFNEIGIPQGATIISAHIQFRCDDDGSDPVELTIYGESTGNAAPYTEEIGNLSARTLTEANSIWNVPPWLDAGDRTDAQKTVDFSSVVQEIVNREDWENGNSLNIILKNTGVSADATTTSKGREAENYSSSKEDDNAELLIVYK